MVTGFREFLWRSSKTRSSKAVCWLVQQFRIIVFDYRAAWTTVVFE
jgi:hypothetical protein